eukprot:TRINITY_DN7925_c0_g1_i1.p1 TRINITY_DN7925_c0_g1~~TRINITY_DN7925_c0_g1_i1.p1  ORF type:complete len:554 (+),score=125.55 TRINITY_DN7925_c0_g1_i1:86-1747(+)
MAAAAPTVSAPLNAPTKSSPIGRARQVSLNKDTVQALLAQAATVSSTLSESTDAPEPSAEATNGHGMNGNAMHDEPKACQAVVKASNGRLHDLQVLVKGKVVYVYSQVDGTIVRIKGCAGDTTEAIKARVDHVLDLLRKQVATASGSMRHGIAVVDAKVKEGVVQVRVKMLELSNMSKQKASDVLAVVQAQAMRIPVPVKVKNGAFYLQTKTTNGIVFCKNGCMHIMTRVDNTVVLVKARGVRTYEAAKAQADAVLDRTVQAIQRRNAQVKDGILLLKGKMDGVTVYAKSKAAIGKAGVTDALLRCKGAIDELRVTKALKSGFSAAGVRVEKVTTYVQDGYIHIVAQADKSVVYVKAKVTAAGNSTKVTIVETYVAGEAMAKALVERLVKQMMTTYNASKALTLAAAEDVKTRAEIMVDRSRTLAKNRPLTASTAGGAAIGSSAGGVAGVAAGTVAGAAAGLPLALFTLGLSIPVGAVMLGTAGGAVGVTVGGTAGAVSGGVVGYGYQNRDQINAGIDGAKGRALACRDYVKETAIASKDAVMGRMRQRAAMA